jgi:hypothetical protein
MELTVMVVSFVAPHMFNYVEQRGLKLSWIHIPSELLQGRLCPYKGMTMYRGISMLQDQLVKLALMKGGG